VLTIETWLRGIRPNVAIEECPGWPPDLFALTGTLIRRSGAYLRLFKRRDPAAYAQEIHKEGGLWRKELDDIPTDVDETKVSHWLLKVRPEKVFDGWAALIRQKDRPINAIDASPELAEQLIRLALIADEASRGMGIRADNKTDSGSDPSRFLSLADQVLVENEGRSFCWDVSLESLCVLGKQHTPLKGATFRSLSHHLALYDPGEINAIWYTAIPKTVDETPAPRGLNLLLLPWPTQVETHHFHELVPLGPRADNTPPPSYFRYHHPQGPDDLETFRRKLKNALEKARQHAGSIDAIVFPELALTQAQYNLAERAAFEARSILICGVRPDEPQGEWDRNECVLQVAGAVHGAKPHVDAEEDLLSGLRLKQAKHHRWYLDRAQIVTYQLGGALPAASRGAWENVELPERLLHFVTLNPITWAVLICEDLARQEPAAELIRAVGPNLLIALLMDGPQLSNRWPARYAAVLAEDPGSSVLTLTSLGMAERSRPVVGSGVRAPVSRVIALWRDAIEGEIQIALDQGDDACVLSLEYRDRNQYSADGRSDQGQTPVYAGYRSFQSEPPVTFPSPPPAKTAP
jgi:hypothetical protein